MDVDNEIKIEMEDYIQTFIKVEEDQEFIKNIFSCIETDSDEHPQSNIYQLNEIPLSWKCGEIFSSTKEKLILVCYLCREPSKTLEEFGKHLDKFHESKSFCNIQEENVNNDIDPLPVVDGRHTPHKTNNTKINNSAKQQKDLPGTEDESILSKETEKRKSEISFYELEKNSESVEEIEQVQPKGTTRNKKYKIHCEICKRYFKSQATMDRHKLTCEVILAYAEKEKLRLSHKNRNGKSNVDNFEVSDSDAFVEAVVTNQCRYCHRRLKSNILRIEHECIHTGDKLYQCDICERKFRARESYNVHIISHKSHTNQRGENFSRKGLSRNKKFRIHCEGCDKYFTSQTTMDRHKLTCEVTLAFSKNEMLRTDSDHKIENEEVLGVSEASGSKVFAEPIEINKCRYCHRRFKSNILRIEHECAHTGDRLYKCDTCPKSFRTRHNFNIHIMSHKKIRPYQCKFCSLKFTNHCNYAVHLRRHTGEKKYKCQYCDKSFVATTERKHHERVHTGEKPFQCNECGSFFSTRSRLNSHLVKHQPERPFKCDECEKTFYTAASLKEHKIGKHTEKKFECEMCGARLATRAYLAKHKLLHFEERQYLCSICGKGFRQQSGLFIHSKTHKEK